MIDYRSVLEAALKAMREVESLIGESTGVYGYHLNGDVAPWVDLLAGDRFECLLGLHSAIARAEEALRQIADSSRITAIDLYKRGTENDPISDPIEALRFFCSFAMNGQDWIDAESFFDALRQLEQKSAARRLTDWQPIATAPSDVVVLLFSPERDATNPARIEARVFHDSRGGHQHAWATHWAPLPSPPCESEAAMTKLEELMRLADLYAADHCERSEAQSGFRRAAFESALKQVCEDAQRVSVLEEAYKIAYQATYQSHDGHWDHTMRGGAGCKECIKAREARNKCDSLINDYRKTLDLPKGNKI